MDDKHTVLVVDDVSENVDILKDILSPHYRVQVATNGRLAIKICLSAHSPDLVLLDIMMPGMDGYEVCRILKQEARSQDIPVLFITAKSDMEDELHGFALGAADYLVKPVSPPIVLARVRTHLSLHDQKKLLVDQVAFRTAQLQARNAELEETRQEVIHQLGRAGEFRDNETGLHVIRMSCYAKLLALHAGLSEPEAERIRQSAPLHDLGKIGIPDHILLKPGKLTDEEFAIMRRHAEMGFKIIGPQRSQVLNMGATIALTHHEKWNGCGYPNRLAGEAIPLEARLAAISDVFDALTSTRPYKKPWTVDDALSLIAKEAGEHFDPTLASVFVKLRPDIIDIMEQYQDKCE
ncbi:MAG: response regulator [Magnetococcus sp. MYC-9]